MFKLEKTCKVSEIRTDVNRRKTQFVFRIVWPVEAEGDDGGAASDSEKKADKKRISKKRTETSNGDKGGVLSSGKMAVALGGPTLGAVTTGIGVLGGMVLAGAATNSAERMPYGTKLDKKEKNLTLACDSYADADKWIVAIQGELKRLGGSPELVSSDYIGDGGPPLESRLEDVEEWIHSSRWRATKIVHGIRIFEQIDSASATDPLAGDTQKSSTSGSSCLRVMLPMNTTPSDVFTTLMNMPPSCRTGVIKTFRVVESLSSYADIVHIVMDPVYAFPVWTAPRDFCVLRYWKQNIDGSYIICWDSTSHVDCPVMRGFVRGEIHAAYCISAPKEMLHVDNEMDELVECLVAFFVQYNPKGWIWETAGYRLALTEMLALHVIDVRDAIDAERFLEVHFDAALERNVGQMLEDKRNKSSGATAQGNV